jgi:RNA polymerase sigma factor CnrH
MTFQSQPERSTTDRDPATSAGRGQSGDFENAESSADGAHSEGSPSGGPSIGEGRSAGGRTPESEAWTVEIEAVYRRDGRELWALFYAQCNDPDRAYDAVQEAFARLQEQNGEIIRDARAWLVRVGRNWLRDVARRQRVAAKSSDGLDLLPHVETDGRDDPRRQLEHGELLAQVREGLAHLKEEDREVLVLRYALGWSSSRIAKVLESSASAVDMRLSRARKRLAKYLESIGAHE